MQPSSAAWPSLTRGVAKKLAVLAGLAAFVAVLWYALGVEAPQPSPLLGRPAPEFTLPLFSGGTLRLSDLRGRAVLINFWASWCIPCRQEAPYLEQAWQEYRGRGFVLLGVNVWDAESDARAYIKEFRHTFPNGMDRAGRIAIAYGVGGVPESYIIDPAGRIVRRYIGPLNPELIRQFLEPLLQDG